MIYSYNQHLNGGLNQNETYNNKPNNSYNQHVYDPFESSFNRMTNIWNMVLL